MNKNQAFNDRFLNHVGNIGSMCVAAVALRLVFDTDDKSVVPLETIMLLSLGFLLIIADSLRGRK